MARGGPGKPRSWKFGQEAGKPKPGSKAEKIVQAAAAIRANGLKATPQRVHFLLKSGGVTNISRRYISETLQMY